MAANPTWYEILGVERDAGPEQIKAAWREATDKFEPGTGTSQFRMFNDAADVLLTPDKRAEYDAELAAQEAPRAAEPEQPKATAEPAADSDIEDGDADDGDADDGAVPSGRSVPSWALAILAVLTVAALIVAGLFWWQHHQQGAIDDARQEAPAAAERALPAVLAYDYRHLDADRDRAARFLTTKYRKEYITTFDKLIASPGKGQPGPAEKVKAVVTANVVGTSVVDAEKDVAQVLVFVNQVTKKGKADPVIAQNRVSLTMVKSDNSWLIDNIKSY